MTSTAGATRLAAYVCSLALVFGLAWAAGRFVPHVQAAAGPEPEATRPAPDHDSAAGTDGLASVAAGYRLAVADPTFLPGAPGELRFTVLDPDGRRVELTRERWAHIVGDHPGGASGYRLVRTSSPQLL